MKRYINYMYIVPYLSTVQSSKQEGMWKIYWKRLKTFIREKITDNDFARVLFHISSIILRNKIVHRYRSKVQPYYTCLDLCDRGYITQNLKGYMTLIENIKYTVLIIPKITNVLIAAIKQSGFIHNYFLICLFDSKLMEEVQ